MAREIWEISTVEVGGNEMVSKVAGRFVWDGDKLTYELEQPDSGTTLMFKRLLAEDITPRRILTLEAFENAIVLHAAIGGSTNALLHLPEIAREAGVEVTIDDFDRIHRDVPVLADVMTTGRYPAEYFWYAGGVPALMLELRDLLHLDCLTVTGKTLGENLE